VRLGGSASAETTTGPDGRYSFGALGAGGGYTVTASKQGYDFAPASHSFPDLGGHQVADFNGTALPAPMPTPAPTPTPPAPAPTPTPMPTPTPTATPTPLPPPLQISNSADFVMQHYRDFLGREPDASGLNHWSGEIEGCGVDAQCREVKRVNVSAAFFLSIEFQGTGNLVYKMYKAGFGDVPGTPVAVRRAAFMADTRRIQSTPAQVVVGQGGWEQQLEANKQAFALEFVRRPAFQAAHGGKGAGAFVDSLFANAGVQPSAQERQAAVAAFGAGGEDGQAAALRAVAESEAVSSRTFNEAFVLMQYFGYLHRDPDEGPDTDLSGFHYWLRKLEESGGDFHRAEMVRAFIEAGEYRDRFQW